MTKTKPLALVTGANRGIGREICRQLAEKGIEVILTARSREKGETAARELERQTGGSVRFEELDVSDQQSIERLFELISKEHGRLDILVNNAGIFMEEPTVDAIRETMETNVYGPFQLCQKFVPLMKERGHGRVINLSSGMGQLSEMNGGYPAYRISKTALNAVTRIFADEVEGTDVTVNSVCPGWVKTDMGGAGAELPVEKGADTIVWLATHGRGCPNGGFFREREPIEW